MTLTTEEMFNDGVKNSISEKASKRGISTGYRNRVILCEPIEFSRTELSVPPYALGALLGDGCLVCGGHKITFSTAEPEILEMILDSLGKGYCFIKKTKNPKDYSYTLKKNTSDGTESPKELKAELRALGVAQYSQNKFIPEQYLFASIEQRRELLKGLMDTDGTAHKGRISFCTISERLKNDFLHLVRSLGYEAHVTVDSRPEKYKNSHGKCWNISILSSDVENIFGLQRKKDELINYRANRKDNIQRYTRTEMVDYGSDTIDNQLLPVPAYTYGTFIGYTRVPSTVHIPFLCEEAREKIRFDYPDIELRDKSNSNGDYVSLYAPGEKAANNRPSNRIYRQLISTKWNKKLQDRRIDECYMKAPAEDRMNLLRGFIAQRGHVHGKRIEFHNSNKAFQQDLVELFESCGYTVKLEELQSMKTWQVKVMNPDEDLVIDSKQRQELERNGAFSDITQRENFNKSMAIVDIRKTDRKADMTCLTVAEGESYILENFIVTHNSTLLHAIGVEDMWYWRGGLLMEPHGDLALSLLKTAPPYRLHDIIYLNVLDPVASPGFNPLELPPNPTDEDRQEAVGAVTSLIAKHFNMDTGYVKLLKMLTNALNALSYVPGATLLEVMQFYNNENIRETILSFVPDGPQKDAMRDIAENAKADDLGSLDNRISRFTTNRYMRHLFGQSHTTVNFFDLMNQGCYIICPVAKGATKDDVFLKFYGSYIVSEVYKAAVMRESIPEDDRVNFALILDEFQNFISEDIEGILAEARKYGLMMMLANQILDQLKPNTIKSAVLNNCATKLAYNLGPTDAPEMAKAFGPTVTPGDLMNIPKYHVMASPLIRGGTGTPFISAVFPPISLKSDVSNITAELIAEISRNRYMKKREDIEKEITDRTERYASGNKDAIIELVTKKNQ